MYICGETGVGKTTLLHNLMVQDIHDGKGFAFLILTEMRQRTFSTSFPNTASRMLFISLHMTVSGR